MRKTARTCLIWAVMAAASVTLIAVPGARGHKTALMVAISAQREAPSDAIGNKVRLRPDGLYEVELENGRTLLTHGPDPVPDDGRGHLSSGDRERKPVCASDFAQHALYTRLRRSDNRYREKRDNIRRAIRRMDAALNEDSRASGGPSADYRVRCRDGRIRVGSYVSSGRSFSKVVYSAQTAGYDAARVNYTIFVDAKGPDGGCGFGSTQADERLALDNRNNVGGAYAVVYRPCWSGATPMHESGHNMGAVQYNAPTSTGTGRHCAEEYDVMCYSPDGGNMRQGSTTTPCGKIERFDCRWNDYFDSAPESGEYLASHWNLGSHLNRFISFHR